MKCKICNHDKLSKEFPQENISDDCEHPTSCCLRCTVAHFKTEHLNCPYSGCQNAVLDAAAVSNKYQTYLDQLFPPVETVSISDGHVTDNTDSSKTINVTTLAGDTASFSYNAEMTVARLKDMISMEMKVEPHKQQLMYNDVILEEFEKQVEMKLKDYKIQPFATVHLMIVLYAIPQNFDHVIFDLFWGYPSHGADFLDASCLIFSGKSHVGTVDYRHRIFSGKAIWHSGDVMDHFNRTGHHTIEIHMKTIPANVTHLYFTLSAWNSPTIAHFPNPSLRFFEASDKQKNLCETKFTHARHSQAVIMCSVRRLPNGWKIFESGKLSAGNARNYKPLVATIQQLP